MQRRTYQIILLSFLSLVGCKSSFLNSENETAPRSLEFKIKAGTNSGGIVENTDLENNPGVAVDAFSGATKTGFNIGAGMGIPVKKNAIETGLDFMSNNQSFSYNDPENGFFGTRDLALSQVMLPLTWNFGVLNHPHQGRQIELKAGPVLQYNILSVRDKTQTLPAFSYNKISAGVTLGISAFPFTFKNNSKLGLSIEVYRGGQIYEDFYNQSQFKMPGSSYARFSLVFQLSNKKFLTSQ